MLKLLEKWAVLAVFLLVTLIFASTSAVAEQSILAGANDIIISGDMAGKTLEDLKGTCSLIISAFVYDTKAQPAKFVPVHIYGDPPYSRRISEDMVGKGLRIVSAENCNLATSGTVPYLGKASRLDAGSNLIGVSTGIAGKSFGAVKGTCTVEKVGLYAPKACEAMRSDEESTAQCDRDFIIFDPDKPVDNYYKGKGIWVKAASDCTLDDGTPAEILCKESECETKSGCDGTNYRTYGCQNKECSEVISKKRECTAEEKAKEEGVNLVPELEVTAPAGVKGGSEIVVALKVKNTGTKSTNHPDVVGKCPAAGVVNLNCGYAFGASVSFRKGDKQGLEVMLMPRVSAAVTHLVTFLGETFSSVKAANKQVNKAIKAGESLGVLRETVKIPEDFSGKLVITAAVDAENFYIETRENDNDDFKEVEVQGASKANLVATEAEPMPTLEKVPMTLESVKIKVQNIGEREAVAENKFLENKVTVKKGSTEICSGSIRIDMSPVKPGAFVTDLPDIAVKAPGNSPCPINDKDANYWAVVEVDTMQASPGDPKGAVTESNEDDNNKPFQLKGPSICSPGSRQAGAYCSIATGTWLTQKTPLQQCSHNFECKTELCVKSKCVTPEQKDLILKIVT